MLRQFLTCHDGFTLCDLYSYNQKHNEANGWNNTDGCDDNHSWNCGEEEKLQSRNPPPAAENDAKCLYTADVQPWYTNVLSGDEFADTRFGNNPYCQDNEISWLDWSLLSKNQACLRSFNI